MSSTSSTFSTPGITCLPSPKVSEAVLTGPRGVLSGLKSGGTWIEMSTLDHNDVTRLAAVAAAKGVRMMESPVTGGVHKAASGEITVIAGGDKDLFELHKPALAAMGGEIFHAGDLGKAAVIKVITNMLAFIHLIAAGEALMLAKKGGIDLTDAFNIIKASSGNSFVHETEGQVILNGSYNINFTMDLALKDLGFALGFGKEFGVPLDLAGHAMQTFVRAKAMYGGGAWSSQVVKLLEEDATGTDLRAPGFPAELTASDLLLLDANDAGTDHAATGADITAWHLHAHVHAHVPRARVILHTHMPYATTLACLDGYEFLMLDQTACRYHGRVAYDRDYGGMFMDASEGDRVTGLLGPDASVLLLGNHGVMVVADTVAMAWDELYYFERACQLQVLALSTGRPLAVLDEAIAAATAKQWHDYPHDAADAHLAELMAILDETEPGYAR
jgi:3-hydroxyisobutyrate dehydrogenase